MLKVGAINFTKKDFTFMADILMFYGIQQINGNLYGDESLFLGGSLHQELQRMTKAIILQQEHQLYRCHQIMITMQGPLL